MKIYKESKLDNGIMVITGENDSADIVTLSVWIKAGSRYEKEGERGYAHLLEHMLLKGTVSKPSPYGIGVIIDRAGGIANASTTTEYVRVFIEASKDRFKEMSELLMDIILNPLIDGEALENEKKVIAQEVYQDKNNDAARLWLESSEKLFGEHPLSQNPSGIEDQVNMASESALKKYYERFFAGDRIAVVATGGLTHEQVYAIAENNLGKLPKASSDKGVHILPAITNRSIYIEGKSDQTYLNFSFLGPKATLQERLALDVIARYAGYRNTSLLYQELRQKRGLIYSIGVWDMIYQDATIFYASTSTTAPREVISVVIDELINLGHSFTQELFEAYKKQTAFILQRVLSDPFSEMEFLAKNWLTYGRLVAPDEMIKGYYEMKYEDMVAVAKKFIKKDNFLVGISGKENPGEIA